MPFSSRDLWIAVYNNNLDQVQTILADRDHNGVPHVNINSVDMKTNTILISMVQSADVYGHDVNIHIFQSLLDVRDNANNPVINLNICNRFNTNIIYCLLAWTISLENRRQLLQRVMDLRDATGELVLHLKNLDSGPSSFLLQAVRLNDPQIMHILLDARRGNGNRILNVNEVHAVDVTILDIAMWQDPVNPDLVTVIQQAGGRRYHDLTAYEKQRNYTRRELSWGPAFTPTANNQPPQQVRPNVPTRAVAGNQGAQDFAENLQNTHNSEVNVSIRASVNKLKKRYPNVHVKETLRQVRTFLERQPYSDKKRHTLACLDRIERDPTVHDTNLMTLSDALALVWKALHDKSVLMEGVAQLTDKDITDRELILFDHLYKAQTEYGIHSSEPEACFMGTFNKFFEMLDHIDPDVTIITGPENVVPMATEKARIIVRDELSRKNIREQRAILKNWSSDEKNVADDFREEMAVFVDGQLKEEYQHLLTGEKRREIISNFQYLPPPILHAGLVQIIEKINAIPDDTTNTKRQVAIQCLKTQAANAYDDNSRTWKEEYDLLNTALSEFNQLETLIKGIVAIPNDTINTERQMAIAHIKTKAAYNNDENTSKEIFESLKAVSTEFIELDLFVKKLLLIDSQYKDTHVFRRGLINDIESCVKNAYASFGSDVTSSKESLLNQIIAAIPYDTMNTERQAAIERIKAKATYNNDKNTSKEIFEELSVAFTEFVELDLFSKKLMLIDSQYKGENISRKESINEIKSHVKNAYTKFGSHVTSSKESLFNCIKGVKTSVDKHHKTYGAARIFGIFQPPSRLSQLIDETISPRKTR